MLGVDSRLTSLLAAKAFTINAKLVPVVDTLPPAMIGDSPKLDGGRREAARRREALKDLCQGAARVR